MPPNPPKLSTAQYMHSIRLIWWGDCFHFVVAKGEQQGKGWETDTSTMYRVKAIYKNKECSLIIKLLIEKQNFCNSYSYNAYIFSQI